MTKILVVVESPAKARTIARYLGPEFVVESSIGHIRDLPSTAAEIPAADKKKEWARLGVDVDNGFAPLYVIPKSKASQVKKLRSHLKAASQLLLATDEDREGEAIAWHLVQVLQPTCPVRRMVFHEITRPAIERALEATRDIDERLVDAQEARRILDRLVGWEVSPLLWRKLRPKLSAGRVQSVATRLVVEREWARIRFRLAAFCGVEARLRPRTAPAEEFSARLSDLGGRRVAVGKDFDGTTGALKDPGLRQLGLAEARAVAAELEAADLRVASVDSKPFHTRPYPPFMTSTLQQEAARKLRFNAQRTMRLAQSLYENGYITYMRTDSTILSQEALRAARGQVARLYGESYLPERPRVFERKSKSAQEAHEAIRPAGESFRTPAEVKHELEADQHRLYELIWKRTLASQMRDAEGVRSSVTISAETASFGTATLAAAGKVLTFPGFLRAYVEGSDDPGAELADQEKVLPPLERGQALDPVAIEADEHTTQPPPRHTEATLIKELEARGIGRPSTYAAILQTIQDRGYAWHKGPALVPTFTAFAVIQLLERHLPPLVDYTFTARMEDELDRIASGELELKPWLYAFYFGDPAGGRGDHEISRVGLKAMVAENLEKIAPQEVSSIRLGRQLDGVELTVRVGRYGPYVQLGDSPQPRVSVPEDLPPDELTGEAVRALLDRAVNGSRPIGNDPATGKPVYLKNGRFGPYVQLGDPEPAAKGSSKKSPKPRVASLWPDTSPEGLSLEDALDLLSYPRELGAHPETGEPVLASFGRYGPYVKMGESSRTLESYETLRAITLAQAVEVLAQPRPRRRRARSEVLAELGVHPANGAPVQLKDGRFGPYVTDGTVNASVPKGTNPVAVTLERAVELLVAREDKLRAQGKDPRAPRPKRGGRRKGSRSKPS